MGILPALFEKENEKKNYALCLGCRVGGDEFLILLFGDNPEESYLNITDSLERKILDFNATEKREIPLSMA